MSDTTSPAGPDDSAEFRGRNLRGTRFVESDLSGVVMRGVDIAGADIDAPWLLDGESTLVVNGVDVTPYVEAQLNERFPGRALKRADSPDTLRQAWAHVETAWDAAQQRAASMPAGTVNISVAGEWSFAQTLRHLVMATDVWLRKAILQLERPYHPLGQPDSSVGPDHPDADSWAEGEPGYDEVLDARADRVRQVRDFLATVTPELFTEERRNPHAPEYPETVLACLHTILEEEWEHLRYALRDLDALDVRTERSPHVV
jgi:hypothetical protein